MAPLSPHDILLRWAVQHGGDFHQDVEVVLSPEKGYHIVVRRNAKLEPGTQVATCPIPCTISILNAIDAEGGFTCRGIKIPPTFIEKQPRENVERFFLMEHHLLGKKSWWAPYIATLPTPEEVRQMQFEQPDDLAWIRNTNLAFAFEKQTEQWKAHYKQGMEYLQKLKWPNSLSGTLTWDLYRWAATIFTSRSFTSQILSDTHPADRARPMGMLSRSKTNKFRGGTGGEHHDYEHLTKLFSEGFPVLVPVLDILNYRPLAKVEWQARCHHVGLEVLEPVEGGEEVCNNYGPRDNETLLLGYAFAVPNNPFDHFSVALRLPEGLSLKVLHTPPVTNGGPPSNVVPPRPRDPELKCYVFKPEHPRATDAKSIETALFSLDLLDAISALRATDREWQAMHNSRKTYFAEALENGRVDDSRNLLATMSQLFIECMARFKALRGSTGPWLMPMNLKQIFAQTYRDSQIDILQIAVSLCRFVLRRAISNEYDTYTNDDNLHVTYSQGETAFLNADQLLRLQTLLTKHKCMSMQNELFGFDQVLGELPNTLALSLRHVMSEVSKERRLNASIGDNLNAHELAKVQLGLTLSALVVENSRDSLTPLRLKSWLDQLTKWYPPDDPNWHYVPDRTPAVADEAAPLTLLDLLDNAREVLKKRSCPDKTVAWLQPKMIAWGWNVIEEEGVSVPMEILDRQIVCGSMEMAFLVYFPQLTAQALEQH